MMRCTLAVPVGAIIVLLGQAPLGVSLAGQAGQTPSPRPFAGIAVWDTGQPSADPLAPSILATRQGWKQVPSQEKLATFTGDAVVTNGRLLAVFRHSNAAVEVYSLGSGTPVERFRLELLTAAGDATERLEGLSLVENSKGAACLEASYKSANGTAMTARFRLKRGEVFTHVEPGIGTSQLRVDCPSRFAVLPDFFADDILIDGRNLPADTAELPSESFVLNLTGKGDAIAMCVFENRRQDVKVAMAGAGEQRKISASEIVFENKPIWIALLEGPGIWHTLDLKAQDAGKVIPLGWHMPFAAQWRVDFTRTNGLTDSWDMLLQDRKGGDYIKPNWLAGGSQRAAPDNDAVRAIDPGTFGFGTGGTHLSSARGRWSTVLGTYRYPCWSNADGQGYIQPLKSKILQFQGPVVVFPINRVPGTPINSYTVVDVVRNTLGVGPCEYILDLEGQKQEYKGRATCASRDALLRIYGKNQQKQKRDEIEQILNDDLAFVKHIRGRINRYVEFSHKMRAYLAEQKKIHPELDGFLAEMDNLTQEIDARVEARLNSIKTPDHVAAMNAEFRKTLLDYQGQDALQSCRKYTNELVEIGGSQDELAGECRWVIKSLRQQAGLRLAQDARVASVVEEIRAKTQEVLRNPAVHEGAQH
jgi:hypothetical protein